MPTTTEASGSSSSIVASRVTGHHMLHIDGYSHTKELAPNGRSIRSRTFQAAGRSWHIAYYPNGLLRDCADHMAIYLSHERVAGEPAVKARAKFSLLDQAGEPVPWCTWTTRLSPDDFPVWGFHSFVRSAWLEASPHVLKDDSFTIRCDIFVYTEDAVTATPPSDLHRQLGGLLASGDAADVAFRVAGETFRAHRCVLAARSPVFKAELLGTMREGDRDPAAVVEVDDMDAGAFRVLLEFAYTDALPEAGTMSKEEEAAMCQHLLVAADRYDMERLKLICEVRLRKHIDAGSAATILALAELHGCPGLKDACFRFIETTSPRAMAAVAEAEGFELLSRSCPSTLEDLVFRIIDR